MIPADILALDEDTIPDLPDPRTSPYRACVDRDPEMFFPAAADRAGIAAAQAICGFCPVLAGCAAWTLRSPQTDGVHAATFLDIQGTSGQKLAVRRRLAKIAATGRLPRTRHPRVILVRADGEEVA